MDKRSGSRQGLSEVVDFPGTTEILGEFRYVENLILATVVEDVAAIATNVR